MTRTVVIAFLLAGVIGARAHAADFEIVMSCPEGANDPSAPDNPQSGACIPDGQTDVCSCRVYWANSGGPLTNVVFQIEGAQLPALQVAYPASPAADYQADGNWFLASGFSSLVHPAFTGWDPYGIAPDGFTLERGIIGGATLGTAGYQWTASGPGNILLSGTNPVTGLPNYSGVKVILANVAAGLTGSFDVSFRVSLAYDPQPETGVLTLSVSADQAIDSVPQVVYAESKPSPINRGVEVPTEPFGSALVPEGMVRGRTWTGLAENAQLRTETVVYLPYWDGTSVRSDDQYDPLSDEIVVDIDDLQAVGKINCPGWACSMTPPTITLDTSTGTYAAPATGLNAGTLLRLDGNRLSFRQGYQPPWSSVEISYEAPLSPAHAGLAQPNATLAHRCCAVGFYGDGERVERCADRNFTFVPLPLFPSQGWFEYAHTSSSSWPDIGPWPFFAGLEGGAIRQDRVVQTFWTASLGTPAALGELENLDVIYQLPGSDTSVLFADTTIGRDADLLNVTAWMVGLTSTIQIWVTSADFNNYGGDADISQRALPTAGDPSWFLCATSIGGQQPVCDAAALTQANAGFGLAEITHVRVHVPSVPQVSNSGDASAVLEVRARLLLHSDARNSTNNSANPCPQYWSGCSDLTNASSGTKAYVGFELGGATLSGTLTRLIEYDPSPRVAIAQSLRWYNHLLAPGQMAEGGDITLGNRQLECMITSVGETDLLPPFTFEMTLPRGWTSTAPLATGNFITATPTYGPLPADYTETRSYDPATHVFTVVVNGTTPLHGYYGTALDQPAGVRFSIPGAFGPGTPTDSSFSCRIVTTYKDSANVPTAWDQTNGSNFHLLNTNPALRASATALPPVVARHGQFAVDVVIDNEVFDDTTGLPIIAGATASADNAVGYYRVNREGDYAAIEQGNIDVAFVAASSNDADDIWVSTAETPTRGHRGNLASNGWTLCASFPDPCDAAALAGLSLTPASIRWVAFGYAVIEMTDAYPRSATPGPGAHVDVPYVGTVTLVDVNTTPDIVGVRPVLRTFVEVRSADTATPQQAADLDISFDFDCDADLGFGYDVLELCDGLDNNCDGGVDEGNPEGGEACDTGDAGVCADGATICTGDGLACVSAYSAATSCGPGVCGGAGTESCVDGALVSSCATSVAACCAATEVSQLATVFAFVPGDGAAIVALSVASTPPSSLPIGDYQRCAISFLGDAGIVAATALAPAVSCADLVASLGPTNCASMTSTLVSVTESTCVPGDMTSWSLAATSDVFVCGNMSGPNDIGGSLAVGGDLQIDGFSVGYQLDPTDGDPQKQDGPEPYGVLWVGGVLSARAGTIWGDGWAGSLDVDESVTFGEGGASHDQSPFAFAGACANHQSMSLSLAQLAPTGAPIALTPWGDIELVGSDPSLNVFWVDLGDFDPIQTSFYIDAPAGSTVLVNIFGTAGQLTGGGIYLTGVDAQHVLYNLPEATSFGVTQMGLFGSLLAPFAALDYSNGFIEGTLVAASLTGDVEQHIGAFAATIDAPCEAP